MPYSASAGISIATQSASTNFYQLTDHNRSAINIGYEIVEKAARMADGTMRKYIVAKKKKLDTSWDNIPSGTFAATASGTMPSGYTMTVDGNKGGAWMKSFYETNMYKPVYVRIVHSQDNYTATSGSAFYPAPSSGGIEYMWAFITDFSYEVLKRYTLTDMVNVKFSFTEI